VGKFDGERPAGRVRRSAVRDSPRADMFQKILIANRGEIAVRVICACKDLGIKTVAVLFRKPIATVCQRAISRMKPSALVRPRAARSYLDIPSVISAAEITNVDAIHPGYGFLSENADFAEVCQASEIKFIGPEAGDYSLHGLEAACPCREWPSAVFRFSLDRMEF